MNESSGCPLPVGPAPGGELEAGKGGVEIGQDDFEMAGGEADWRDLLKPRGEYGNCGEARAPVPELAP